MKRLMTMIGAVVVMAVGVSAQMAQTQMAPAQGAMMMKNEFKPFTKEAHAKAMAEGKTTLVFFHAPWCPVCRAQEPRVLAHLNGAAKDVVAFKVDYDSNAALRTEMNVTKQSTLILYSGMKETARLSYKSDEASIAEFMSHATMKMTMSGGR
jgi:thiol:disulfide interchange protein